MARSCFAATAGSAPSDMIVECVGEQYFGEAKESEEDKQVQSKTS